MSGAFLRNLNNKITFFRIEAYATKFLHSNIYLYTIRGTLENNLILTKFRRRSLTDFIKRYRKSYDIIVYTINHLCASISR